MKTAEKAGRLIFLLASYNLALWGLVAAVMTVAVFAHGVQSGMQQAREARGARVRAAELRIRPLEQPSR